MVLMKKEFIKNLIGYYTNVIIKIYHTLNQEKKH